MGSFPRANLLCIAMQPNPRCCLALALGRRCGRQLDLETSDLQNPGAWLRHHTSWRRLVSRDRAPRLGTRRSLSGGSPPTVWTRRGLPGSHVPPRNPRQRFPTRGETAAGRRGQRKQRPISHWTGRPALQVQGGPAPAKKPDTQGQRKRDAAMGPPSGG